MHFKVKSILKYISALVLFLFLGGCAQVGSTLTGGAKDRTAPKIDSLGTYPLSGQTNFSEKLITIRFQEYISLNKPNDNIIITPQLAERPIIKAKNKKLTIEFVEDLEENTTYTINFNHAIADITEKNDSVFQYVFSTGDYIDSLKLLGSVKDAFTNRYEDGFLVGLYNATTEQDYDSIPMNERPVYITETNEQGVFQFNYLKEGEYYLFAIEDKNKNMKLDQLEKMAFPIQGKILVNNESTDPIELLSFASASDEVKLKKTTFDYPGRIKMIFTNAPKLLDVKSSMDLLSEDSGKEDSLLFWLKGPPESKMQFIVNLEGEIDTIKPLYKGAPKGNVEEFLQVQSNVESKKILPEENLKITFSEPIDSIDFEKVHFFDLDSNSVNISEGNIENLRSIVFPTFGSGATYMLIDSGAIFSFYKTINKAISIGPFENRKEDYYGSLIVNTDSVFDTSVIIQLLDNKQEVVRESEYKSNVTFEELLPGKYQLRLIFDRNSDGEWTTGSLNEEKQPETTLYNNELIDVKSKWEKEIDWILKK